MRPIIACVLLLAMSTASVPAAARAPTPAPRRAAWWHARHEQLKRGPDRARARLIFLGDSITSGWLGEGLAVWKRYFGKLRPLNLGVAGDRTRHLHWRLQHGALDGLSPELAVVHIGINDVAFYSTPSRDVADGVLAIVDELRSRLPACRVLLLALLPSGPRPSALRDRIARVNRMVARAVDGKAVLFLDAGKHLLRADGVLTADVAPDYLHPSEKGYRIWAEAMSPAIRALLEGKR